MQWASALSTRDDVASAMAEVLAQVGGVSKPDLVFVFTSGEHTENLSGFAEALWGTFGDACVLGAASQGVIGAGREIEGRNAVSVTVGRLPGVAVEPVVVRPEDGPWSVDRWRAEVRAERGLIVVADPFSFDLAAQLPTLQHAFPNVPIVGGLGSASPEQSSPRLLAGGGLHPGGLVGVGLSGRLRFVSAVAQGCRPLGAPMFVTHCEGNRIFELDGRPVVDVLRELYATLDPIDQALFGTALFLGVQMRDQHEYAQGDFLIRNLVGISSDPTALVTAYIPERFQVVQLHVRDEQAARDDLARTLDGVTGAPRGGLLVSCVGRGEGLFGEPDHDSRRFAERFADAPIGGFFGNGEVGPVQGQSYVHGYTSVFGLFAEPDDG